ncbi:MAG: PAS domain S-box protein [Okeania sp. SIO3I5]|uniref:ATP-binding protein n=1 Tax=Okeania sp. SIO3I5 TaxID=2607805 RepID=UPI0013BDE7B8|nr:ATP-binding protein [Okeania sp. SIO3I5]NEQ39670.1 PAS domain S-box protein [Okeania sp. SIO3I5]
MAVETQEALKLAACIGNRFELQTLAVVCQKPEADMAADIWGALQEGLILPISQSYKFFQGNVYETKTQTVTVSYRFLHDRVQQAAYSLIPEEQKQVTHLTIGRLLLQSIPENEQEEKIFSIVNQLNLGRKLIVEAREREELAQLNLKAGEKAQLATAFTSALEYGQKGMQLLSKKPWQEQYHLCLKLHQLAVEAAYGAREFEICENLIQLVLKSAQTTLEKVKFYHTQIGIYVAQKRGLEAIEIGRQILRMLGVELPNSLTGEELQDILTTMKALIPEGGTEALLALPTSVDPYVIAVMETLAKLSTPIFTSNPTLFPLLFVNLIKQTLTHGTSPYSAVGYSHYSLLCSAFGDLEAGYQFGELALKLLPRFNNKVVNTQVLCGAACTTHHWKIHLKETLVYYQKGAQAGLEAGDFLNVAWNYAHESYAIYLLGRPLPDASQEINVRSDAIGRLKQESHLIYNEIVNQCVRNLLTPPKDPCNLTGDILNEQQMLAKVTTIQDTIALFFFYSCKFQLCYLLGRYQEGLKYADLTMQYSTMAGCFPFIPVINFYMVLTHFALWKPSQSDRQLETIKVQYEKIKFWGNYGPMNHQHKFLLIEAEKQKNLGNKTEAIELYDRAIAGAKENEYIQEEALANELAAKFYLDWGKNRVAAAYMIEAYYCYARWGAKAKTDDLEKKYPQLLQPVFQQGVQSPNLWDTLTNIAQPQISSHSSQTLTYQSQTIINTTLDLAAVLKSSQALSEIIQLDRLLHQLSHITLENSGADRCLILIPDDNNTWRLRAVATTDSTELCTQLLTDNTSLPVQLIQYVKNTQEVLVINNLDTDLPIIDNYLQQNQPQSILCLPMLNQGKLIGILYLQNQLTLDVFTPERILMLNFLSNQAAISIKNAQLHQKSELSLQQVKQSQNLLRKVIDTIPQFIFWKDRDSNFLGCNQKFATMAGVNSPEDLVGKNDYELPCTQEEADFFRECDRRVMESNQAELHIIETQKQLDGTTLWLDTNKMPLCDESGEVYGILGSYEDISDRLRLEQEQKRLSAILEATSDYVGMIDTQGTILWMNAQFKKLRPELHCDGNSFKFTENHPQWANEIIINQGFPLAARDGIWFGETAVIDSTRREIAVSQIIIAHKSADGVPEYFSTIIRNISQLKATETALREKSQALEQALFDLQKTQLQMVQSEKMSALGNLMAGVAHEINNPTSFLAGNIQHAQEYVQYLLGLIDLYQSEYPQPTEVIAEEIEAIELEFLREDLPKLVGSMNVGVERIRNISSSLRTFARKDQEHKTTFQLHEGIDSTLLILKHRTKATEKRPVIEIVRNYGEIPLVECFPGQLNQVFMNILANAIDAFDQANVGKTLDESKQKPNRITLHTSVVGENLVQIQIEDNGCGMKPETKERIFEHGFTTKGVGKGTGLGMAIAHQIITEKHGGKITCDSTLGKGTIFAIVLPIT